MYHADNIRLFPSVIAQIQLACVLAPYPIATMTSFLCGSCNGASWIFQDQVALTIYNGGDTARIVADGAQFSRIDLLHFHRGILAIFRVWPLVLQNGNRQTPMILEIVIRLPSSCYFIGLLCGMYGNAQNKQAIPSKVWSRIRPDAAQ